MWSLCGTQVKVKPIEKCLIGAGRTDCGLWLSLVVAQEFAKQGPILSEQKFCPPKKVFFGPCCEPLGVLVMKPFKIFYAQQYKEWLKGVGFVDADGNIMKASHNDLLENVWKAWDKVPV